MRIAAELRLTHHHGKRGRKRTTQENVEIGRLISRVVGGDEDGGEEHVLNDANLGCGRPAGMIKSGLAGAQKLARQGSQLGLGEGGDRIRARPSEVLSDDGPGKDLYEA